MKEQIHSVFNLISVIFEDHKFARRFMFFWAIWMVTDVYFWFKDLSVISDNQRFIILGVFGFLSLMIGFYQWSRGRD